MFKDRRKAHLIYFVIDFVIIISCFYLACRLNRPLLPQGFAELKFYFAVFVFWGTVMVFFLHNSNLYSTNRNLSIIQEWGRVSRCVLFASVLAALFIFILKITIFSRLIFIESTLFLIVTLSLWRTFKRIYIRYLMKKGHLNYHVLIIGAGKIGLTLAEQVQDYPNLGIKIIGFLDDAKEGEVNGFRILGKVKNIEEVVRANFIDEIYVTIPSERKTVSEVIIKGTKLKKSVRVVAEHFDLPYRRVKLDYIGFIPLVTYLEEGPHASEHFIKRFLDVAVAGFLLVLLFPVLLCIALLIKLDSPGPVLYISKRCGKRGRVFDFYKFRSMIKDADRYKERLNLQSEVQGPIFKIRRDPRITRFGKILRKYSLDELPQLINVIKGDMSLVGTRPFPVEETKKIENKYITRLNIKPGITGLAQISGRSNLPFRNWVRWDTWYINNWSLGLDLKILLKTVIVVIKGTGAY
ncbi:MAG: sugar transferase [Candidatus Omnitrophica bacterium]|nr:sugar transferase [Candidatus Omnitrophota bacterium]